MAKWSHLFGIWSLTLILVGCVQPTVYGPMDSQGGYDELRIEDDRFRVRFVGNSLTPRDRVEAYLLYRSAEIALENDHPGFLVVERSTEPVTSFYSVDHGTIDRSRYHYGRSDLDFGARVEQVTPVTRYEAFAEILLVEPPFEGGTDRVYNARQVIDNLKPLIRLSQETADQATSDAK